MPTKYSNHTVSPVKGGALMSRVSASAAGLSNYLSKRDFRRDSDFEMRREGCDYFGDFEGLALGTQPFPAGTSSTDEITLIHMARSAAGKTQVVVGTKTDLYVFNALEFEYVLDPTSSNNPYVDPVNVQGGTEPFFGYLEWQQIGTGFSSSGRRWEAVNVAGYTIFNNGVDLPVSWKVGDLSVTPLYELRDLGVAHVGTIAAFSNILMLGDIREIPISQFSSWMNGSSPYGAYPAGQSTDRYQFRLLWSSINSPTEFGVAVSATSTSGSTNITMGHPSASFLSGDKVVVIGAGVSGGNLYTSVASVSGTTVTLSDQAQASSASALIQKQSAIGADTGYDDLQDDAAGILKMSERMGQLVIYKDTSVFLARYTGVPSVPFEFSRVQSPAGRSLYYKNTLVNVDGRYHIYAGRSSFYRFDLQNRQPKEVPVLDTCSNLFYDDANTSIANTDSIFAAVNANTREIWFVYPTSGSDKALCYDTRYGTASTTSIAVTAASTVKRPTLNIQPTESEDWFVMGTSDGVVLTYGLVDQALSWWGDKTSIFYRRTSKTNTTDTESYTSTISSGLSDFGDEFNEKDLRSYLPNLSSQQGSVTNLGLGVKIFAAESQTGTESLVVDHAIDEPRENLVSLFARAHNFRDEVVVTGKDNPVKLASRTYEISRRKSGSATRRDD